MKFSPLFLSALAVSIGFTSALQGQNNDPSQKPDDNRFTVVPITQPNDLNEPMMFEVAPDGRAFIIERRGALKVFDPATQTVKPVGMLAVNNDTRIGNGEQGLVGMTLDPDFDENGWMYLYYQHPVEEKSILSRWEIRDNVLVANSEAVLMEWPAQRETCCHTGGGMAWDGDGNLFLTVGNNRGNNMSAHTDERPGRAAWDDQGGSANANSLEGKILRIHPEADGTYTIPEGNLFPPGMEDARPEIYTMGHRNAWRVTVDSATGYIYWGEVGPDARENTERGPLGYDEFNQAKGPGFFGWPYFIGDKAYPHFDYEANQPGEPKDPNRPVNNSPNNTGIKQLPPHAPTFVFYPYGESEEYPALGSGGRSATGGPIYHRTDFEDPKRPWPAYFEGKWIATDLSRRLIVLIEMHEDGAFKSMERFLPDYRPVEPIDMKFGPDGDLYVLEYGGRWFQASPEAKLTRIEYEGGNRTPIVMASADKTGGIPPFEVQFSSQGTEDYDYDPLDYRWDITDLGGNTQTYTDPNPLVTLDKIGTYTARLTATDPNGASASQSVKVVSGNEPPTVAVNLKGNESFYFAGTPFGYEVDVVDREDGTVKEGRIDPEQVVLSIDYASADFDYSVLDQVVQGDPAAARFPVAMNLITKGNCNACHLPDTKLVGPSFKEIAAKYRSDPEAQGTLAQKIVTGGSGVWGEVAMPPNASINESDATALLKYIFSFAEEEMVQLPLAGLYTPALPDGDEGNGSFIVRATYTDRGDDFAPSLSAQSYKVLRSPVLNVSAADEANGVESGRFGASVADGSYLAFKNIDLTGVRQIEAGAMALNFGNQKGGDIEIRLGSPTGKLIGSTHIDVFQPNRGGGNQSASNANADADADAPRPRRRRFGPPPTPIAIEATVGRQDVYVVFKNSEATDEDTLMMVSNLTFLDRPVQQADRGISEPAAGSGLPQ